MVTLTVDQEKILVKQYNKHPNELWFIHGHKVKALAMAMVGDFQGADDILSGKVAGPIFMMRRGFYTIN